MILSIYSHIASSVIVIYRRARLSVTLSPLTFSPPEEEAGIPLASVVEKPVVGFSLSCFVFLRQNASRFYSWSRFLGFGIFALTAEKTIQKFARNHRFDNRF